MDNNPFRQQQPPHDKLAEAFRGDSLNPEDDPEQQPPPYSFPQPQTAFAPGMETNTAQAQAYDAPKDRSLPQLPGEASAYYTSYIGPPDQSSANHQGQYGTYPPSDSQPTPQEGLKGASSSSSSFAHPTGSFNPKRNPLDPPPPAFTRPIAAYLDPRPFPPLSIQSFKTKLEDGFPSLPAAPETHLTPGEPHPFSTHDIPEADWLRFLEDIAIVAKLDGMQKAKAGIIPIAMHVALPFSFLVSKAMKKKAQNKKNADAAELVDTWNQFFFQPRHVRAILTQGSMILTSPEGGHSQAQLTALSTYGVRHQRRDSSPSCSSSSSDSDDDSDSDDCGRRHGQQLLQGRPMHQAMSRREEKQMRRAAKREYREKRRDDRETYRAERRARRQARREMKREKKKGGKEKFRIVLVPC